MGVQRVALWFGAVQRCFSLGSKLTHAVAWSNCGERGRKSGDRGK